MPVTKIDEVSALVVIDLQKGIAGMATAVIEKAAQLARAFRERGLPVVLVNVTGMAPGRTDTPRPQFAFADDWAELVPELEQAAGDHLVSKQRWGAFPGTGLEDYLKLRGATQIVLAGVATSIGVESTARSAYDLGYNVVLVTDAMADRSEEAHRYSVEKVFPRLGETGTTDDVLKLLR